MLDSGLAGLYGVETGALNQVVKRKLNRFPDFRGFRPIMLLVGSSGV